MNANRNIVATGKINDVYGVELVKIEILKRGRHAGRFVTRGAGFAGRIAYTTVERAKAAVESHAHFAGWEA